MSEYPLKERNQFALYTIGYEGPVLNQIVKRRHAGTARFKRALPVKMSSMLLKSSDFSDGRHGWCCLTAHQLACLEKLVLRYSLFSGYRKNECQCVLSFQPGCRCLGWTVLSLRNVSGASSSRSCSSATSAIRTKQASHAHALMSIGNENDQVK
jgi:hypothetical protein